MSFLVLLKNDIVLGWVLVELPHPCLKRFHLLVSVALVTDLQVVLWRQLQQEVLVALQVSQRILMFIDFTLDCEDVRVEALDVIVTIGSPLVGILLLLFLVLLFSVVLGNKVHQG